MSLRMVLIIKGTHTKTGLVPDFGGIWAESSQGHPSHQLTHVFQYLPVHPFLPSSEAQLLPVLLAIYCFLMALGNVFSWTHGNRQHGGGGRQQWAMSEALDPGRCTT